MAEDDLRITLAHSPDPHDPFMWWPQVGIGDDGPAIDTGRFTFSLEMDDIETLNQKAEYGAFDITAISMAQYPRVRETYALTGCGASVGNGYGPKLIGRPGATLESIRNASPVIAVPGERTSALAASRLLLGSDMRWEAIAFDTIEDAVLSGRFDAGVVIHEGQLTCERRGLEIVVDLGAWWHSTRGLLLPLGGNAIKRDLESRGGPGTLARISGILSNSLRHAMAKRDVSLAWALQFGRGIDLDDADTFVEMYVNRWTLEIGPEGETAVARFLGEAFEAGVLEDPGMVDFVRPAGTQASGAGA